MGNGKGIFKKCVCACVGGIKWGKKGIYLKYLIQPDTKQVAFSYRCFYLTLIQL